MSESFDLSDDDELVRLPRMARSRLGVTTCDSGEVVRRCRAAWQTPLGEWPLVAARG